MGAADSGKLFARGLFELFQAAGFVLHQEHSINELFFPRRRRTETGRSASIGGEGTDGLR